MVGEILTHYGNWIIWGVSLIPLFIQAMIAFVSKSKIERKKKELSTELEQEKTELSKSLQKDKIIHERKLNKLEEVFEALIKANGHLNDVMSFLKSSTPPEEERIREAREYLNDFHWIVSVNIPYLAEDLEKELFSLIQKFRKALISYEHSGNTDEGLRIKREAEEQMESAKEDIDKIIDLFRRELRN